MTQTFSPDPSYDAASAQGWASLATYAVMREAMVKSQLRTTAVNDPRVVAAMGEVPRERFVPAEWRQFAYADREIPLAEGRTLADPMVTGRLLTELRTRPADRALVVGAGTGYTAAVLAELVAHVIALEADATLVHAAEGIERVEGPLAEGWASGAPYDIIYVDGAIEQVPEALVEQLADGGRLAAAIVGNGVARLSIGTRVGRGFGMVAFAEADVAVLPGFARPHAFTF